MEWENDKRRKKKLVVEAVSKDEATISVKQTSQNVLEFFV
jgi:hypothetical protein